MEVVQGGQTRTGGLMRLDGLFPVWGMDCHGGYGGRGEKRGVLVDD